MVPQRATTRRYSKNQGVFPASRAQDAISLFGALWGRQPEKRLICRVFSTARHFELWRAVVCPVQSAPLCAFDALTHPAAVASVGSLRRRRYLPLRRRRAEDLAQAPVVSLRSTTG
jgi:hypothetical protein